MMKDALAMGPELTELYRHFHRHPEPSHGEIETNRKIREALDALSIPYLAPKENLTIALIQGTGKGNGNAVIGIRCDTDALQMEEKTGLPYASCNDGMMHGCGHDAHITMGLGAAKLLWTRREMFSGLAKIIFQPAEEGERGAQETIATGLVSDVTAFIAIHVWSLYETGTIHISPGPVAASTDMFTIRLTGKGGHGAYPHLCVDAVTAGAAVVEALQHIPSRFISPMDPVVVTVGSFHGGTRCNIIAEEAVLEGTFRTFGPDVRREVLTLLDRLVNHTAAAHGCKAEIDIVEATSATINDEKISTLALSSAKKLVPPEKIGPQAPGMVGDDFAEYSAIAPGCYVQLGIANREKKTDFAHHHGCFAVDEDVLPLGAALLCQFVLDSAGIVEDIQ